MLDYKVTLRISSKDHSLEDLSSLLGKPSRGYSVGDLYSRENKNREFTLWCKKSSSSESFELQLIEMLNFLESNESIIINLKESCEIDLFCMLRSNNGQGATKLSSPLMRRIAYHDLNITLDFYLSDEGSE
jgi:hypothetical protein